jgi:hypothetical protein
VEEASAVTLAPQEAPVSNSISPKISPGPNRSSSVSPPQATEPAQDEALMLPGRLVVPFRVEPFDLQDRFALPFLENLPDFVIVTVGGG